MNRRLVAMLMASVLLVAACDEDMALAQDFIKQWALDHAGEIAKTQLGIPSGDTYVDAAVEAGKPVLELQEADNDMAKGRANQDPKAMDDALKIRPHDWTYELSRADLALQMGDMSKYDKVWTGANHDYPERKDPDSSLEAHNQAYFNQEYDELESIHNRLTRGAGSVSGYKSYEQCDKLYERLIAISGDSKDQTTGVEVWGPYRQACQQIPH